MKEARGPALAVAQTSPIPGDVSANVDEHLHLLRIAAAEGAHVVVFPELSLTGYELGLARDLAFSEDDPRLLPLLEAATSSSTTVIVGAPVRLDALLHIGAFIVRPGRPASLYTKRRLGAFPTGAARDGIVPPAEATVFRPGDRDPLVPLGDHAAALAVCADIGDPAHARRAADRGAGLYLASMFVIPSEFESETAKLQGYAAEHSMVVAFANFGSRTGGLAAAGHSSIWSGRGELVARLEDRGSGVAFASDTPEGWRGVEIMAGRR